ncbi:MAG: HAD hydrolase-like protein [Coriobacteriaceae bacterium]|nr:HAD hydrolase-like protein [Coriobacteriaceae bacterium]
MDLSVRRLVVFDWDGTLCDSMAGIIATARSVLLEWGMAEEDLGDLTRLVGPPFPQAYSWVYGLSEADAAEVTRRYRARYEEGVGAGWPLFEGIPGLIDALHAHGKLVAIASSKRHDLVMRQVRDNGLAEVFDAVCGKLADTGDSKEAAILRAVEQTGCTVNDTVMVGDRDLDVFAARNVGIPCIGVLWGRTAPREELEAADAAAIADTVADLEALLTTSS